MSATHDLPLPDFDQLSTGDITHRIRALELDQVKLLLDHERQTAGRTQVQEILSARIGQLESGAEPSGGTPTHAPPSRDTSTGSAVGAATAAEATSPLRHGVADQTPKRGKP
ncbi:hypothetical protein ACLTEW_20235 [Gordonia lacunae]|uniref:hypothetical protein n=1 Tax=Gordonia lacunae TaxID=417102 RepID=UPI0039E5D6D0